jgi:hypothetical protein
MQAQPSKYAYVCECRSAREGSTRNMSTCSIKMLGRAGGKGGQVQSLSDLPTCSHVSVHAMSNQGLWHH